MERKEIAVFAAGTVADLIEHPASGEEARHTLLRVTSGTSGGGPLFMATGFAPEAGADMAQDGTTRVVSCIGSLCTRLANALVVRQVPDGYSMRVLPFDPGDLAPGVDALLADYAPDVLYGFCSFVARLTEHLDEPTCAGVASVKFSGESLHDSSAQLYAARLPNATLGELYMANEVGGYIGRRLCAYLPPRHFHPGSGAEVAIENTDEEGVGDIAITKTVFRDHRVEKYSVGDIGRFVPGACVCGEAITFELLGRKGIDYVKASGALVRREEFDRVLAAYGDLVVDYRADVRHINAGTAREEIHLRILMKGRAPSADFLREMAAAVSRRLFLTPTLTLQALVERGIFLPLQLEFTDQPFPESHKSVKIRRL